MKKVKLWGGASDGMTLELSEQVIERRTPIECVRPQPIGPVSVWDARVRPKISNPNWERDVYDHRLVMGTHDHPCMKGLVVQCEWDAWVNGLQAGQALADVITHTQRPDRVTVLVADNCPWVR